MVETTGSKAIGDHLRAVVEKVTKPTAQVLFETSAEMLIDFVKVFEDQEKKTETV